MTPTIPHKSRGRASREKGKRGERQWRDVLRAEGYSARRGQQFSGSPDSPDVVCDDLPDFHFEVKCVERLNIEDAMGQARQDARRKLPLVAHRRSHCGWLVTMDAPTFFRILRGDLPTFPPAANADPHPQPLPPRHQTDAASITLAGPTPQGPQP